MPTRTYSSLFEEKLMERVEKARQSILEELEGGQAVQTLEQYRQRVGYLSALRDMDGWCMDTEADLNKG